MESRHFSVCGFSTRETRKRQCIRALQNEKPSYRQGIGTHFPSGHDIITARVVRKPHQFLYSDDNGFNFMDQETFDQIIVEGKMIENNDLLKEGDVCDVILHEEQNLILATELPNFVVLEVTQADPNVKGNSASNVTKTCIVETGAVIKVPMFVEAGNKIKIDARTRAYMDRA